MHSRTSFTRGNTFVKQQVYLENVFECIKRIEVFMKTAMIQNAVIRNFEIMGATKRIAEDIKQKYPEVPWRETVVFRNILIHDYLKISLIRVWDVIEEDLSKLKKQIELILQELGKAP
ncbi:DUF86 domain-containing protein [Gloeocapsopsis dulcis]|uniref:DUF86 domain-containing protein n=1 Tax=Gloeocapsopsis dulcis AAB1 = 1H9 TaxID=1433147 RepID=A0A6N8FTV2_9CHRO|nr:HepT-like ribonuclease domain-containing protein [Gloeocapsopsis dulcis]MUL35597.1 DUF86 domain-containing protein [Gloeocapsopsis dulcis AAB1 = 1H9]WNN87500.1 DUF86 domain-containing protein [Gloeocapsopsis dulcis]